MAGVEEAAVVEIRPTDLVMINYYIDWPRYGVWEEWGDERA